MLFIFRSGGAAAVGDAVNNGGGDGGGGGGGGGGDGQAGPAPPADLPPPYDLVYEENITPPTYEEVIQEEAKVSHSDPV